MNNFENQNLKKYWIIRSAQCDASLRNVQICLTQCNNKKCKVIDMNANNFVAIDENKSKTIIVHALNSK